MANFFGYDPNQYIQGYEGIGRAGQALANIPSQISQFKDAAQMRDVRSQQMDVTAQQMDIRNVAKQQAELSLKQNQNAYDLASKEPEIIMEALNEIEDTYKKNSSSTDEIKRNRATTNLSQIGLLKRKLQSHIDTQYMTPALSKDYLDTISGFIQDESTNVDRSAKSRLLAQKPSRQPFGEYTAKTPGLETMTTKELSTFPISQVSPDAEELRNLKNKLLLNRIKLAGAGLDVKAAKAAKKEDDSVFKALDVISKATERKEKFVSQFNKDHRKELDKASKLIDDQATLKDKAEWLFREGVGVGKGPEKTPAKGLTQPTYYTQNDYNNIISKLENMQEKINTQNSVLNRIGKRAGYIYDVENGVFRSITEHQETQDILTKRIRERFEPKGSQIKNKITEQLNQGAPGVRLGLRGPDRIRETPKPDVPVDTTQTFKEEIITPSEKQPIVDTTTQDTAVTTPKRSGIQSRFQALIQEETEKKQKVDTRDALHKGIQKIFTDVGKARFKAATENQLDNLIKKYKDKLKDNAKDSSKVGFGKRQKSIDGILNGLQRLKESGTTEEKKKYIDNLRAQGKLTAKEANMLSGLIPEQKGTGDEKLLKFRGLVDRLEKKAPTDKKMSDFLDYVRPHLVIIENFMKKENRKNFKSKNAFNRQIAGLKNSLTQVRKRNRKLGLVLDEMINLDELAYVKK